MVNVGISNDSSIYNSLHSINIQQCEKYSNYITFDVDLIDDELQFKFIKHIWAINGFDFVDNILTMADKEIIPYLMGKPKDYFVILFETQKYLIDKLNPINVSVRLANEARFRIRDKMEQEMLLHEHFIFNKNKSRKEQLSFEEWKERIWNDNIDIDNVDENQLSDVIG